MGLAGEGAAPQQPSASSTNDEGGCGGFSTRGEPVPQAAEQPQLDALSDPAPEGIELVRRVIEQIKAKKAARIAEKLAECFRD